jgi:hypothetical protein
MLAITHFSLKCFLHDSRPNVIASVVEREEQVMPLPGRERARSTILPREGFEVRSTRLFEVKFPLPLTPSREGREYQYYMVAIVTLGIIRRFGEAMLRLSKSTRLFEL